MKIFTAIFFMTSLSLLSFSQSDSTDLTFSASNYIPQTFEDSLNYGAADLSLLHLEFEIDDLVDFGKVWVEVISIDAESGSRTIFYDSYTLAELTNAELIEDDLVQLDLTILQLAHDYQVVIRIEDTHGHEKVSITKSLAE